MKKPLSVYRLPFTAPHISCETKRSRTVHGSRKTVSGKMSRLNSQQLEASSRKQSCV